MPQLKDPAAPGKDAAFSQFPCPALREWAARPLSPAMRQTYFGPIIANVEVKLKQEFGDRYNADVFSNDLTGYTMRTDRYRLTLWLDDRDLTAPPLAVELYDHKNDPHETMNIADRPTNGVLVQTLTARLIKQLSQSGGRADEVRRIGNCSTAKSQSLEHQHESQPAPTSTKTAADAW